MKARRWRGDADVGGHRERHSDADGDAVDAGEDRLLALDPHDRGEVVGRVPIVRVRAVVLLGVVRRQVEPGTEGVAIARQGDGPDVVFVRRVANRVRDRSEELAGEGVLPLGTVQAQQTQPSVRLDFETVRHDADSRSGTRTLSLPPAHYGLSPMRRVASVILLAVAGLMFPVGILAAWAQSTLYDSEAFSERAVEPLNSQAVRTELARRLTAQLVEAGNQQATEFRPAFELALQGLIDTDTFKQIFRNAVRRTHEAIIQQGDGGGRNGLDLGASFALITSSLQAGAGGGGTAQGESGLDNSLSDITSKIDDYGLWDAEGTIGQVAAAALLLGLASAVGSIVLAEDRRRAVRRLGIAAVIGGLFIVALLFVATRLIGRQIEDSRLGDAITAAMREATGDLRLIGLWVAAYGLVVAAAATGTDRRYTPAEVWRRTRGWVERRRQSTPGTILLGVLGLFISLVFIQEPLGNLELLIRAAALWVGYLAVIEILRLVRVLTATRVRHRALWPRLVAVGGAIVVILGIVTVGFVLTTRGAAKSAEASDEQLCNRDNSLCDLRLDQVTFPGEHHAFASPDYPGYLFAQQTGTITDQLNAGVRAVNIDTHYGVPSAARLPGEDTPIVLTDKAAEVQARSGHHEEDVTEAKRAAQLAAAAPKDADAQRGIYMCHSNCETGAIELQKGLGEIKTWLDGHPDDVLMLTIHDFTSPADTAAVIEAAGLGDRVATLHHGEPLPTLRSLIDSGRTLLVFAERGDPGGPPWYHNMYDWFQETTFSFSNKDQFNCAPNRGRPNAKLFLINHWLTLSPPNPAVEAAVNSREVLEKRVQQCLRERGLAPNIIQVQFAERGDLFSTVQEINDEQLKEQRANANQARIPAEPPAEATPAPESTDAGPVAPLPDATEITTLTGGDPVRFCRVLRSAKLSLSAWAVAVLQADPDDPGLTDLAYASALAQDVAPYVDSAPQELVERAMPILDRARQGVASLRALGLDDRDIKRLADAAPDALLGANAPDGTAVRAKLVEKLDKKVDHAQLRQAAAEFYTAHGDATPLLDLGFVPPEVGVAAGYPCASEK